ncbi:Ltp family lipoprotein [Ornithinimicrobium sp. W1679]|uniref:Ltp family lipoprotein n=1 Tax=Ornithinimicrobium sp. W1679 TaxID=3418770 RepID=UPI003CF80D96
MLGVGGLLLVGVVATAVGGDDEPTETAPVATSPVSEATPEETTEPQETTEPEETTENEETTQADEAEEPAAEETTEPEPVAEEPADEMSSSQRNAVRAAQNYLEFMPFSRQGLIEQLSSEYGDQYSVEDATFAVDTVEDQVDWNEQAALAAENYLETMPFSRQGLIEQLSSEYGDQYTPEQATSGVDAVESGVDWNEQAARAAESYLETMPFSRQELIDQLSSEYGDQYTLEQATYGVDQAGL